MSRILFFATLLSVFSVLSFLPKKGGHPSFPYDLDQPNATFELQESLKEISGLAMSADGKHLVAVNDEEGIIYLLDKLTGHIVRQVPFGDAGDYEGLEVVGDDAWVIKSNGTLFHVKNYLSEMPEVIKYKSFLNKENDVEGLGHDPHRNSLLIGCKGKGVDGPDYKLKKAVYEFQMDTRAVANDPVFLLSLSDVQEYLNHIQSDEHREMLSEVFSEEEGEMIFSPSGIAVHPLTGEVYVTSSKGKMLLVLGRDGKIQHLVKLKKKIHQQPEGICFDQEGTLYIANEGKTGKARIYKFLYRK